MFEIDERLSNSSFKVFDFDLSELRLKNNSHYPWVILIPRVENRITELFQLSDEDQITLMREITKVSLMVKHIFNTDKVNVAAIGNIVSQLHIHIVGRRKTDSLWPHSVWQESITEDPYSPEEKDRLIKEIYATLS